MKNSFKKLFACLMALIMVMTVTPFTAVTASAAEAKSSNIAETEAKYKTAPSTTFTAKKGMSEVGWLNCTEVKTTDGQTYRQSFAPSSNVLYWPSNYVGTADCIKANANRLDFRMYYPSAVLMWDGSSDTYMPVVCIAQNTGIFDGSRTIFYAAPYDVARPDNATSPEHSTNFFADRWRGISNGQQIQDFNRNKFGEGSAEYFEANVLSEFVSNGENANKYYNFGDTKDNMNFASFLHVDSGITFDDDGYMSEKLYWTTNSLNSKTFNPSQDNNSWQSSSTIYVVNYKPIADAANEACEDLKNLVQTDYTPEAINAYYDAIQALYDFDPNTYFDQNDGKTATDVEDIALRVGKCTTEIKKLVDNYEAAKQNVENSRQYRISFTDANGALIADHYYKANETIIQPSLDEDKFVNTDPEGHYTVSYEWQPAISATATADVSYVEKAVIPAKTPHTYSDYTPVYQGGQYAHTRKCTVAECGYVDWQYCTFVRDDEKSKDATCTTDEVLVKKCSVCGQSYTDTTNNTKALGHDMQLEKTVAPTCTEEGYDLYKCSRCDVTEKRNIKPATSGSHDYQFTKTVAPTCNEEGYDLYTCSKCGTTEKRNVKPADATKHNFTKTSTVAPTCTEKGYDLYTCSRCGATEHRNETAINPNNHSFTKTSTVSATCTEKGYDIYTCSRCHKTEHRNETAVNPNNHSFTKTSTVAPTCTEKGYDIYTCSRCHTTEHRNETAVNPNNHNFTKTKTVAPTCKDKGYDLYTCTRCNKTEHRNETAINPNNHNFVKTSTVAPTCTDKGYDIYTCSLCGKTEHRNEVPAIAGNHTYQFTKTVAPNCKEEGYDLYTCSKCGATEKRNVKPVDPNNHNYTTTVVAPTCNDKGYTKHTCTRCGNTYNDNEINKLGHSFTNYVSDNNATCTQDGTMTAKCDRCDATKTITAPNSKLGHDYKETVTPATCTEKGYTTYVCSRCNDTYVGNYTEAIGHSYNNVVTPATCTQGGYITHTCSRGDSTYVDSQTAPLGHSYSANIIPATTTAQGYTVYTCTRCGDSYVSDYTPVLQPTLTPDESKISKDYGVDAKTAQDINYILIINNVSKDTASLTESRMTANPPKGDGDYKGSSFGLLRAQTTKLTKNSVTVKWNKVKNADGYIVYGAKCGAKSKYKVLKVVSGKTTSYTHKKLKKGTYYKYNVVAFKYVDGVKVTIAASKKVHATTQGGKYGVAKSVKLNKSKATIKKGKTFKIKASEIKKDKKIRKHRGICYESSNTKIATVDSKGKIKAKKKGKCTIYVYAQNGVYKTVKVTVK